MDVKEYNPPNWFSASGIARKRKQIEGKGIPDMTNARFITLTIDPWEFRDELHAYEVGKDRIRRFTDSVRKRFKDRYPEIWTCWKLEFHSEKRSYGWPHWHLAAAITHKLSGDDFRFLEKAWGLGRVNVKRIKGKSLDYFFKYCFKAPFAGEAAVPDWFADHLEDGKTFSRARFWQASRNFYTGVKPEPSKKKEQQTCWVALTVREQIELWAKMVQLVATGRNGEYLKSSVTVLQVTKREFFAALSCLIIGGAAVNAFDGIRTHRENIKNYITKSCLQNQAMQMDRLQKVARSPLQILSKSSQISSSPKSFPKVREYTLRVS